MIPTLDIDKKELWKLVSCYVKGRKYMYDKKMCPVDLHKLRCLQKVINHLKYSEHSKTEHQVNIIRQLVPELEAIMPGVKSKKYSDYQKKLVTIKALVNG